MTFKDILSDNRSEKLLSCEKDVTTKEMTRFDRKIYIVLEVGKQLTPEIYIHSVTTVIKKTAIIVYFVFQIREFLCRTILNTMFFTHI